MLIPPGFRAAYRAFAAALLIVSLAGTSVSAQQSVLEKSLEVLERYTADPAGDGTNDPVRELQADAMAQGEASWGHWGPDPERYSSWSSHSNRLIPIYTFGMTLESLRQAASPYASADRISELYGSVPEGTLNPDATYLDQTGVHQLQLDAARAGKKRIILFVFDGMDWQTTRAAAVYAAGRVAYTDGRGTGLAFQDYQGTTTDFGYFVTSPQRGDADYDVDAQLVLDPRAEATGGYDARLGGETPWATPTSRDYLIGLDRNRPHTVTDSASSATSMTAGVKTYNSAINVSADGKQVEPVARLLQREHGFAVGLVTSVPVSHATPASAYANNVTRDDYQDIARDQLGLRSIAHRDAPLPGAEVVIGGGWGEETSKDAKQGANFVPGNKYVADGDIKRISVAEGGSYVVATRTPGHKGTDVLRAAADKAIEGSHRLFGFFGADGGHLPYRTADGQYNPAIDISGRATYSREDVEENPTLAAMTTQALRVLQQDPQGFWLLVEPGDVDWANHANNLDNSIGAVLSGDAAFAAVVQWIEQNGGWEDTAVIVTADHGHYLNLTDPSVLIP